MQTLEQMESVASEAFDSIARRTIRGQTLAVERCIGRDNKYRFEYTWGKNIVPREVAANVLWTAD